MTYFPPPWPASLKRICSDECAACGDVRACWQVDEDAERLPPGAALGQVCRECWMEWTKGSGCAPDDTEEGT